MCGEHTYDMKKLYKNLKHKTMKNKIKIALLILAIIILIAVWFGIKTEYKTVEVQTIERSYYA